MATHPSFPSIEVTSVPMQGKFYQPKSGDSIVLISNRAYGSGGGMLGAHVISDSAYNRRTFKYAMGGSYNCKATVNAQTANALVVLCGSSWPPIWIPELASKAEPEAYGVATDPKTGTTTIPSGSTSSSTGVSTGTTKKTPWKVIGFTILGVVAVGLVMLKYKGKK